jgi:2-amino-4-hydroxy-6-hydroxymethyldihydropteridine diphosphokinase
VSRAVLSVGSNIGDRMGHLQGALDALAERVDIVGISGIFETSPVGGPEQGDFLNAVIVIETDLTPHELLALCQQVEADRNRVREVRWGPRTLDVDIIAMDGMVLDDPALTLPHPRAHERAFVCVPWLDVDADAALPHGRIADLGLDPGGVHRRTDLAWAQADRGRP